MRRRQFLYLTGLVLSGGLGGAVGFTACRQPGRQQYTVETSRPEEAPTLAATMVPIMRETIDMTSMANWAMLVDRAAKDESLERARKLLIQAVRQAAAWPIVRRAQKLGEVGKNRTWLDGRSKVLEPEIKETFALAMSDHAASSTVAEELPLLATAYRLTGDALFRDRVVAQLI